MKLLKVTSTFQIIPKSHKVSHAPYLDGDKMQIFGKGKVMTNLKSAKRFTERIRMNGLI